MRTTAVRTAKSGSSTARRTGSRTRDRRLLRRLRGHRPREPPDHRLRRREGPARLLDRQPRAQARDQGIADRSPVFEDVRVPRENVIGEVGRGLSVALGTLERTRLGAAAQAVGIAQGATDYAIGYAKERIAFGKPIIELQGIQFKLADMRRRRPPPASCSTRPARRSTAAMPTRRSTARWRSCSPPTPRWR